jgi:hypothetical protein
MKDQFAAAGCRVDILSKTLKSDMSVVEVSDGFNEVL